MTEKVRVSPHGGYLNEGAISSGTLRTQDLLRAFADELERLVPFNSRQLTFEARSMAEELDSGVGWDDGEEVAKEVLFDLDRELNHLSSPHGLYFGTQEGDGACFGFWREESCDD